MNVGIYREGGPSHGLPLPRRRISALTFVIGALALVAIVLPPSLLGVVRPSGGVWRTIQEAGVLWALPVLFLGLAVPIVLAVLGALFARGKKVPTGLFFLLPALPFLMGTFGRFAALRQTFGAISVESVDGDQKLRIMAEGAAEAMGNDVVAGLVACGCAIVACAAAASGAASIDVVAATRGTPTSKSGVGGALLLGALWLVVSIMLGFARFRYASVGVISLFPVVAVAAMVPFAILAARGAAGLSAAAYPDEARRVLSGIIVAAACAAFAVIALERAIDSAHTSQALSAIVGDSVDEAQRLLYLGEASAGQRFGAVAMTLSALLGAGTFLAAASAGMGVGRRPVGAILTVVVLASALGVAAFDVGHFQTSRARATAAEANDAVPGVTLPVLPQRSISRRDDGPGYGAARLVLRADGSSTTDPKTSCVASMNARVQADRAATAQMLSDLLRTHECADATLVLVAQPERDPSVQKWIGDLAHFLPNVGYVHATATSKWAESTPDVAVVRSVADDAIEVDGVRTAYPVTRESSPTTKHHVEALRFVFRPTDSVERIARTVSSVRNALGDPPLKSVVVDLGLPRPPPAALLGESDIALGKASGKGTLRQGATQVNGRLPPEVIQHIVRQSFGRFRLCYENGLRTSPELSGRVTVKFVIDRSGAVSTAADGGSDLPDPKVIDCIVRGFGSLAFPKPEGSIVTVVYPIIFTPGT